MPRGRHRHSPPLHRLLPPSAIAGVSVLCAAGPWLFSETVVLRALAAGAAVTAILGAVVMRRWDVSAGKHVADLTRARASDEWRHEERVAELETDLDESRELRSKLEQKLRAKRTELAGLRNEHAALLRRYATAETERATALEGRRLLAIEAGSPETSGPEPTSGTAAVDASDRTEEQTEAACATDAGTPGGLAAALFLAADTALDRLVLAAPAVADAHEDGHESAAVDASPQGGSGHEGSAGREAVGPDTDVEADTEGHGPADGVSDAESDAESEVEAASDDESEAESEADVAPEAPAAGALVQNGLEAEATGVPVEIAAEQGAPAADASESAVDEAVEEPTPAASAASDVPTPRTPGRRSPEKDGPPTGGGTPQAAPAQEDEVQGKPQATTAPPAGPRARPSGHFTVPTAVAVAPAAPERRKSVIGGFDFFGTQKGAAARDAVQAMRNEDLADVIGQAALALHKAESESGFKPADEESRGVGQVIDLTAHDETEQIDVAELRSAVS